MKQKISLPTNRSNSLLLLNTEKHVLVRVNHKSLVNISISQNCKNTISMYCSHHVLYVNINSVKMSMVYLSIHTYNIQSEHVQSSMLNNVICI